MSALMMTAAPPREEIDKLRKAGMSRDQIASHYGVPLSRVKRWIKHLEIEPSTKPMSTNSKRRQRAERKRARGHDDGLTLLERSQMILGKRMSEDFRGYLLDGRPVRLDVLLKAAGLVMPEMKNNA